MSQPRQPTPNQSPTPSKSSLRRTSGSHNPSQRSFIPPPSPRFDDQPAIPVRYSPRSPPNQTLEYESDDDDEPLIYPEPPHVDGAAEDSYFPYPTPGHLFQPFFTLIEDGLTSEHHHPSVHYIFADDDTDIITEAALNSLDQDQIGGSSTVENTTTKRARGEDGRGQSSHSKDEDESDKFESRLPPPPEGTREHYLIIDVHPSIQAHAHHQHHHQAISLAQQPQTQSQSQATPNPDFHPSYTVTSYTSLSSEWQISSASITSAPTMGNDDISNEDEGLMLRIEGRGVPSTDDLNIDTHHADAAEPDTTVGKRDRERETLEEMIERFQTRLGEVRKLVDVGGGGGGGGVSTTATDDGAGGGAGGIVHVGIGIRSSGGGEEGSGIKRRESTYGYGLEEQD